MADPDSLKAVAGMTVYICCLSAFLVPCIFPLMFRPCALVRQGLYCRVCFEARNRGGRGHNPGLPRFRCVGGLLCMVLKRGHLKVSPPGSSGTQCEPCALMKSHPFLWAFLTQCTWEDGSSRLTGTLTLSMWDGGLRIALNDRETESSAFLSGSSFTSLLKLANAALEEGKVEFRPNPWAKKKKSR